MPFVTSNPVPRTVTRVPAASSAVVCDTLSLGVPVGRGTVLDGGTVVGGTVVVDAVVVDCGAVVVDDSGAEIVVGSGADVVVDSTAERGAMVVVVSTTNVVVDSSDASVAPSDAPPQAETVARHATLNASNERLTPALRRRRAALVPLSVMVRRAWVVGSLLVMAVVGCGTPPESGPGDAAFILSGDYPLPLVEGEESAMPTVTTGGDGVQVEVTDTSRIIVLNQAIAEIVVSLGMQTSIIGRDATTTIDSLADVAEVSNGHDISAESVLSLRPTVVIGDTRTGPPEVIEQLRGAGVPVLLAPEVWTLSELPLRVRMIAAALGVPGAGERLVALSETAITNALEGVGTFASVPRVAFLYVRGTASVYLLGGSGSGADELVAAAGGIDVGASNGLAAFTPLTAEAIVQADPDVLLVMTRGLDSVGGIDGLLALPGVSSTRAATARAVIAVDDDLLLSFGPRTGALIARLAKILDTYSSDT